MHVGEVSPAYYYYYILDSVPVTNTFSSFLNQKYISTDQSSMSVSREVYKDLAAIQLLITHSSCFNSNKPIQYSVRPLDTRVCCQFFDM